MKRFLMAVVLVSFVSFNAIAAYLRVWKSSDGSQTLYAKMEAVEGDSVVLRKKDGRKITVPISKLSAEDQDYIKEQTGKTVASGGPSASSSSFQQGVVLGPFEAGSEAHYLLYVPRSLKPGRKAPLLFYTQHSGGAPHLLESIREGAELTGWIAAASIESRNGRDTGKNMDSAEKAVKHIVDRFPVDDDRLYFTGNSGGAAMAFYNCDNLDGYGVMPSIGYLPNDLSTPDCDCFIINGAFDYNRYASACVRRSVGKSAVQRFFNGGHQDAPAWLMVEGMVWLEGRYLADKGKRHPDKLQEYENAVIDWIDRLKGREPYRAYYWSLFLRDELDLSQASATKVKALVEELGSDNQNRLYVEALEDIDDFAQEKLTSFGTGSLYDHTDPQIISGCEDLLEKYAGVPMIDELLHAFCKKTTPR